MLSDSIHRVIHDLLEQIEHYSREPFKYGCEYKEQFITALANLYFVMYSLNNPSSCNVDMEMCIIQARTEIENIYLRK